VELPITVVFEPPSLGELRALLRRRRWWVAATAILALVIGLVLVVACVSRAEAEATAGSVPLSITSHPAGATILVDGHHRGHAPALLQVAPGRHRVALRSDAAVDADYAVDVTRQGTWLDARLWRREPLLRRLRPSLPGALLDAVYPLDGGRVALVTRSASDAQAELHAWDLDPVGGRIEPRATALPGSRLALTGDGAQLAYIGRDVGPSAARSPWLDARRVADTSNSIVWHTAEGQAAHAAPRPMWRAPAGEALVDLSWSPTRDAVLAVTASDVSDGTRRSRLFLLAANAALSATELIGLPSTVVLGAYAWSPNGQHVAFVAHAGALNALCLLGRDGSFRYLADLDASETPPLPYLPVAWSPDSQRLLFVAPRQQLPTPAEGWLNRPPRRVLYVADVDAPDPRLVAEVDAEVAAWREDGRIVLAARQRDDGRLDIQLLDEEGQARTLVKLPLRVGPRYAVAWNTHLGQLLVADATGGGTEFWLVGLGLEQPA
jgi:PEGA domain